MGEHGEVTWMHWVFLYISRNRGLASPNWFNIGCLQIFSKWSVFLRKLTSHVVAIRASMLA